MIDMIARVPGPRNWGVWIVLVAQIASAAVAIGSLASAAAAFMASLVPIPALWCGWIITVFAVAVVWSGAFDLLKTVMSLFVFVIVLGVCYVAFHAAPGLEAVLSGLLPSRPSVPPWAANLGVDENPWREVLPLIGWSAGGFASQVWYTYWVMGAGYGAARGRPYGEPADEPALKSLTREDARRLKGWCRVVYADATLAMVVGLFVTACFLVAGAGILGVRELAPDGPEVAITLSTIFSSRWGELGGTLFMVGGLAALIATQIGQLAGWPRLLADTFRICIPGFKHRLAWKQQYRAFLLFFLVTNMIIVYTLGVEPVVLVKLGAILDGLLLTPFQAAWVLAGLYVVMPRLLSREAATELRPNWVIGAGLIAAFLVFGYFCVFQIPFVL